MALTRDGRIVVWGFNTAGQFNVPASLANVVAIAARGNHSMVLVQDRNLPARANRALAK